jgi:hypothetical protein
MSCAELAQSAGSQATVGENPQKQLCAVLLLIVRYKGKNSKHTKALSIVMLYRFFAIILERPVFKNLLATINRQLTS